MMDGRLFFRPRSDSRGFQVSKRDIYYGLCDLMNMHYFCYVLNLACINAASDGIDPRSLLYTN